MKTKFSDDGEKHIMLGGLYKTYTTMNSLLLAAILAVTNEQYLFSIRNK